MRLRLFMEVKEMDKPKRNMRDSVFVNMFRDKKYLAKLYLSLHPEDTISEDDLEIITIENVLADDMYNDLGFLVKGKLIVLVEAQTTWSKNIIVRMFLYLARTYQDLIYKDKELRASLYGSKRMELPTPELYVIYTGDKGDRSDILSLKDDVFPNSDIIDLKAKVIFADENRKDIIGQYIAFCVILKEQMRLYKGDAKAAIRETIRICIEYGNLGEYLSDHKREVEDYMFVELTQEQIIDDLISVKCEDAAITERIETARELGIENEKIIPMLMSRFGLTKTQAEKKLSECNH